MTESWPTKVLQVYKVCWLLFHHHFDIKLTDEKQSMTIEAIPLEFTNPADVTDVAAKINEILRAGNRTYVDHILLPGQTAVYGATGGGLVLLVDSPVEAGQASNQVDGGPDEQPIYRPDFVRIGEEHKTASSVVSRSWSTLEAAWERAAPEYVGRDAEHGEWVRKLFLTEGAVSYRGLKHAVETGLYQNLRQTGPGTLRFIEKVLAAYDKQLAAAFNVNRIWYAVGMKSTTIQCVGYSIDADIYQGNPDKVLLVLHGWGSSKHSQEQLVNYLIEGSASTAVVIEYSGHGNSPFDAMEIRPAQHFIEVITAFDWLKREYPKAEISVMGTSYGGYMAVQLTKYRDFENLILRVPAIYTPRDFYSLNKDIDRQHQRSYREDKAFLDSHPLLARASQYKGRTLVVSHGLDELVPKETTDKYIEVFKADSYCAKGWHHAFNFVAPESEQLAYKNAIRDWLQAAQVIENF